MGTVLMPKDRNGSAAAIVVFALAFMGLLAVAGLETAVNEQRGATAMARSAEALYAAEAGLNSVLGDWPADQFVSIGVGDSLDMGWDTLPNGARYRAVIRRYDDGAAQQMRAIKVEAQGRGTLGGRGVLWVWTTVPILHLGAVNAGGLVTLRGGAISDAYDSREGYYGAGPVYPEGHIMTNGSLSIEGAGTQVQGDAIVGGIVVNPGGVTGTVTQAAAPVEYPTMPCPTTGYTPAANVPTGPKITYSEVTGDLSVTGDTIRLTTGTYFFHSVDLSGQTKFVVPDGHKVEIFIEDGWTVSGQAQINNLSKDASNLSIYGCGTSTTPWSMSAGNEGYFTVYAPLHPMLLSGGNAFYGAMTVGALDVSGGAPYHFDKALLAGNHRGQIVSRSWTQQMR
ncbi:MAG TPA: hypothetical protein VMN78_12365 [Longimicrobiales bacterium]|nr:hypothetical protein [Longimicrobiales bacterium]